MTLVELAAINNAKVEKNGAVCLTVETTDQGGQTILIPPSLVASLLPMLARARMTRSPEDDQALVAHAGSTRVLLHKPSGRAFVRFDEGTPHELNVSLDHQQLSGFVDLATACLRAMEQRNRH